MSFCCFDDAKVWRIIAPCNYFKSFFRKVVETDTWKSDKNEKYPLKLSEALGDITCSLLRNYKTYTSSTGSLLFAVVVFRFGVTGFTFAGLAFEGFADADC